jgi:DNA-binding transcriptional regulator LsrR (DeoR family)
MTPEDRPQDAGSGPLRASELQRAAVVARRYFLDGLSKSEIAAELGISRFKVARVLDDARAAGIVRIEIRLPPGLDLSLAARLTAAYGLRHATVVETPIELPEIEMRRQLAAATAGLLTEIVTPSDVLGIGYGRTFTVMAEFIDGLAPCPVVQLTGALLGVNNGENSTELVRQVSSRSGGPAYPMYVPQVLPDGNTAQLLRQQPDVAEAHRRFKTLTKAVVAVGSWDPPLSQLWDALPANVRNTLRDDGVAAELCAILLDERGRQVAPEFTERCISINAAELRRIDEVIAVAGGASKIVSTRAVLRGGWVTSLVTDTQLACALLEDYDG